MFGVFEAVLEGVLSIPYLVVGLLVTSINGWIVAIAALGRGLAALLPGLPGLPSIPAEVAGGVAFFLPIAELIVVLGGLVTAWITWLGLQAALRWVRMR